MNVRSLEVNKGTAPYPWSRCLGKKKMNYQGVDAVSPSTLGTRLTSRRKACVMFSTEACQECTVSLSPAQGDWNVCVSPGMPRGQPLPSWS